MQDLTVVGVENGALLVTSDEGTRYRVDVDESYLTQLRRAHPQRSRADAVSGDKRIPPREIQAHIRAGMSAEDVADLTGAALDYVDRFVGPVMAEREYVVETALNVAVNTPADTDPADGSTFGSVIRARLADGGAADERWASWKDPESGWIVKLTFTADTVEHDARWSFEPRKHSLSPLNSEAIALSQQGEVPASLIPRLRAVPLDERNQTGRFDSGAFSPDDFSVADAAVTAVPLNQTADLLEALRRRRGERDARVFDEEPPAEPQPTTSSIRLVDVPLDGMDETRRTAELPDDLLADFPSEQQSDQYSDDDTFRDDSQFRNETADISPVAAGTRGDGMPNHARSGRKGRPAMPSWDEIVFGARSDDDL